MQTKDIQKNLIQQIRQSHPHINLAEELTQLFNTTSSGAYRRIKGETLLSIDEMVVLLNRYPSVSFDKIVRPNQIPYLFSALKTPPRDMVDYLNGIELNLKAIASLPKAKMAYAAQEVPFFHYLLVPEMAIFKLYMWSLTVWNIDAVKYEPFDLDTYQQDETLQGQMRRVANLYASIPSEEVWNGNMLDITLNQMRHCYRSGRIKKESDMKKLLSLLRGLTVKLQNMAIEGAKKSQKSSSDITVWNNELVQNNAFILVQLPESNKFVYNILDAPNFMHSTDADMYHYSESFFNKLKSYSVSLIGGVNERNCELFFQRLNRRIDIFEQDIFNEER